MISPEATTAIATLVTVIGILWKLQVTASNKEQQRLQKCEALHEESSKELIRLTGNVSYLEGRMDGVEQLSASVLNEIGKINNGKNCDTSI